MGIFKRNVGQHIPGNKNMSKDGLAYVYDKPEYVYIPLTNHSDLNCKPVVNVGDHVKMGQVIGQREGNISIPMHASVSGEVVGIEKHMHRSGRAVNCVVIKNDYLDTLDESVKPKTDAEVNALSRKELAEIIQDKGIVGLGGSGFSTYIKFSSQKDMDIVLLNGAECEPYITADYRLMKEKTRQVLLGVQLSKQASGAKKGVVVIKKGKPELRDAILKEIKNFEGIELVEVRDVYPAGWERWLVKEVFKKDYDKIPAEIGIIVDNVGTAFAIYEAVRLGRPLMHRYVTVTGEGVKEPRNYDVRIGTKAKELVELSGGYVEGIEEITFMAGGPMMGKSLRGDDLVVSRGVNNVLVLPTAPNVNTNGLDTFKSEVLVHGTLEEQPCLRCGACVDNCPSFLEPVLIKDAASAKNIDRLADLNVKGCIECGMCTLVCPSNIAVTEWVRRGKRRVK